MIKYIGSKRTLVPKIVAILRALPDVRVVGDLFSGTARVGHALKRAGYHVWANDHNRYAAVLARCYVQADCDRILPQAEQILRELAAVQPIPGYVTETFCERSRYFHPKNGARIDAIRERIATLDLEPELEAVALTSLMEAADRVDSTTGVQMAYLKSWAPRALNDLELRLPEILSGVGVATELDAVDAARQFKGDLIYLDPPYNQHSYMGNYHVWESLMRWDKPEVYGIACKRVQTREYSSAFNSKRRIQGALQDLIEACNSPYLLVSFNNEGYIGREAMESLLEARGYVATFAMDFKRYVGAQIGIYNPSGEKVGRVSHLRNLEYLYLVAPSQRVINAVRASLDVPEQLALMP